MATNLGMFEHDYNVLLAYMVTALVAYLFQKSTLGKTSFKHYGYSY